MVVTVPLMATVATAGLVLCICHDGHVSIEANCNSLNCCSEEDCNTDDSQVALSTSTPLHSCVDLSLDSAALEAVLIRSDEALIVAPSVLNAPVSLPEKFSLTRALPVLAQLPPLPVVGGDYCVRTVVLTV